MGYYQSRLRCTTCGYEWNTFFSSVDMSSGMMRCPQHPGSKPETVAHDWKMEDGRWLSEHRKDTTT